MKKEEKKEKKAPQPAKVDVKEVEKREEEMKAVENNTTEKEEKIVDLEKVKEKFKMPDEYVEGAKKAGVDTLSYLKSRHAALKSFCKDNKSNEVKYFDEIKRLELCIEASSH